MAEMQQLWWKLAHTGTIPVITEALNSGSNEGPLITIFHLVFVQVSRRHLRCRLVWGKGKKCHLLRGNHQVLGSHHTSLLWENPTKVLSICTGVPEALQVAEGQHCWPVRKTPAGRGCCASRLPLRCLQATGRAMSMHNAIVCVLYVVQD